MELATDSLNDAMKQAGADYATTAVLLIDHGSRRSESNDLLLEVVQMFESLSPFSIVLPAHMELAEPSIQAAFDQAVEKGAKLVVAFPYFLSPGRHWKKDVPQLVAEAAQRHFGVRFLVTAPLGLHPLMAQVIADRIATCVKQPTQGCEICTPDDACGIRQAN
ncbi:MAG: cobalamin biosynthesis protein CbiX [Planctomycetales bacterium]|nr:cobalamin biosynthesis protein CbiX [Planctomycetales bacterium]